MRKYDYSFLDVGMVPANMVDIVSCIDMFKKASDERKARFKDVFTAL